MKQALSLYSKLIFIILGKDIIKNTCQILTEMVASASEESKKSRYIIYNSVQEVIAVCSKIIAAYFTELGKYFIKSCFDPQ